MKGCGKLPVNYMLSTKLQTDAVGHDHQPLEMKLGEPEVWSLSARSPLLSLEPHWILWYLSVCCL